MAALSGWAGAGAGGERKPGPFQYNKGPLKGVGVRGPYYPLKGAYIIIIISIIIISIISSIINYNNFN